LIIDEILLLIYHARSGIFFAFIRVVLVPPQSWTGRPCRNIAVS
jgi:hypothetical protein